jgi:hypothetical protein
MKRLLLIAALAAGAMSCVEGNRAIQILEARRLTATCDRDVEVLAGFLNYDASNAYLTSFTLFTPLQQNDNSPNRLDFFGKELVLNYTSKNPSVTFTEEIIPIHLVITGNESENFLNLDVITDKARAKLEGTVPQFPESMTLLARLMIRGELSSGNTVETNEVTFPIQITRAGPVCPAGEELTPKAGGCFNPGQDGQDIECRPATP